VEKDLRVGVLSALESRLSSTPTKDTKTQAAAIGFLPVLTGFLTADDDVAFKVATIACIDRISELYGLKGIASVVKAAAVIQNQCLGSEESQLRIVALLCLASMVDILMESIIPIVPEMMPKVFQLLEESMGEDGTDGKMHNACFSLLAAVVSEIPFMISEDYLDNILTLSAESANTELENGCEEIRHDCLDVLAREVEINQLVSGLSRTWTNSVENGVAATQQALELLRNSIEHSSKSSVVKTAKLISSLILQVSDLRHIQFGLRTEDSYEDGEVNQVEATLHEVVIRFIYRLSDNTFRPLLTQWVDWAVECPGITTAGLARAKMLRQTSLFNFMTHFFATLKSIVTSYASYVLDPTIEVLKHATGLAEESSSALLMDTDETNHYLSTLSTLMAAASHDQDSFFASLSQFTPLHEILIAQLGLASHKTLNSHIYTHVIPAIVALAGAVVDTPAHHVSMNKLICKLRHSEHAGVRMATIKCQAALTASEEVGEEWVSNIVSGGGETMVYVNEMLEDDDEGIEREVRKWVRKVREMVGEDVFET